MEQTSLTLRKEPTRISSMKLPSKSYKSNHLTIPGIKTTGGVSPRGAAGAQKSERSTSKNGKFGFGVKK